MARPPIDPRLWRYAHSARRYLTVSVGLSLVTTVAIVIAAVALGRVLAGVITDPGRREISAWTAELLVLGLAVGARVLATWCQARIAHRAGAAVVAELENAVLTAGAQLPPRELETRRTELAVVVSSGLYGLRAYLTGYLPALLLAIAVPPIVLSAIAVHDPTSGLIVLITLPLIPIFMILIGLLTEGRARKTLDASTQLSDQLLDLFAGMPTLRALGRETSAAAETLENTMQPRVRALSDTLRRRTMSALRMAFLSSMVLELLATLSVALVAVSIGLRLVFGEMSLYAGIVALVLAPEVYLPLRMVGERFHAAEDGMAAADKAFAILDRRPTTEARTALPDQGSSQPGRTAAMKSSAERIAELGNRSSPPGAVDSRAIQLDDLTVVARDGAAPHGLSAPLPSGALTVLTGPNGSGKSTVLQAILGLVEPDLGTVRVDGVNVRSLEPQQWWSQIAWLPQRPVLVPGTLDDNVELLGAHGPAGISSAGQHGAETLPELESACAATGFDAVLDELPDRWDTVVGAGGAGLSLGQRQRLALTRVLAADRPILLLDEPTAHLDSDSAAMVVAALVERARAGATVVVVAHHRSLLRAADHVVTVRAAARSAEVPV